MSFDLAAIGRPGPEHRYDVTEAALRAYADATDDEPGGPVFAVVPVFPAIAPASRSVASDEARKRVVHYEQDLLLHRPIEPGMTLASRVTPTARWSRTPPPAPDARRGCRPRVVWSPCAGTREVSD